MGLTLLAFCMRRRNFSCFSSLCLSGPFLCSSHHCYSFLSRYFVLTASDVEEWYQNPELFYHEQDSVLWSERLRPCAEALYIVLFENHSQVCLLMLYGVNLTYR